MMRALGRRRFVTLALSACTAVTGLALAGAPSAGAACSRGISGHCYARADFDVPLGGGSGLLGGQVTVTPRCAYYNGASVDQGVSGVSVHLGGTIGFNTGVGAAVEQQSGSTWLMNSGGFGGSGPGIGGADGDLEAGTEVTNHASRSQADFTNLAWYPLTGTIRSNWVSSSAHAVPFQTNGEGGVSIAGNFGSASLFWWQCSAANPGAARDPRFAALSARGPVGDASAKAKLLALAALNGDDAPTDIVAVASTRQVAVQTTQGTSLVADPQAPGSVPSATSGSADLNAGVVVLTAHGHFTANDFPLPGSAAPPSGSVLTVILNAATGEVTDVGISDDTPSSSALGAVRALR
jgi:hypothetical protein